MKKYLIVMLVAILASCEDNKRASNDSSGQREQREEQFNETLPPGNIQEERDALQTEKEEPKPVASFNGRYRKTVEGKPAADCNCNCIDISFDGPTEWCIIKDKVYINARCEKTGENTADLYLVNASRDQNTDRPFPWDDFDTDAPIASLEFQPDGGVKIDWKGFSTGGKIATDYAIYGKKTLEGTYQREL